MPEGIWGPEGSGQGEPLEGPEGSHWWLVRGRAGSRGSPGRLFSVPAVGAVLSLGSSFPARPFRGTAGSQRYGEAAPAAAFPKETRLGRKGSPLLVCPAAGGRGRLWQGGHGVGTDPVCTERDVSQPARSQRSGKGWLEDGDGHGDGDRDRHGARGLLWLCQAGCGGAAQGAPTPRAPVPRECPAAGSLHGAGSWPEPLAGAPGRAVPRVGSEPPVFGGLPCGPAPPRRQQEVQAGLWSIRCRRGRGRNFSCLPEWWVRHPSVAPPEWGLSRG